MLTAPSRQRHEPFFRLADTCLLLHNAPDSVNDTRSFVLYQAWSEGRTLGDERAPEEVSRQNRKGHRSRTKHTSLCVVLNFRDLNEAQSHQGEPRV